MCVHVVLYCVVHSTYCRVSWQSTGELVWSDCLIRAERWEIVAFPAIQALNDFIQSTTDNQQLVIVKCKEKMKKKIGQNYDDEDDDKGKIGYLLSSANGLSSVSLTCTDTPTGLCQLIVTTHGTNLFN